MTPKLLNRDSTLKRLGEYIFIVEGVYGNGRYFIYEDKPRDM